jgi:hypothetical protein
LPRWLSPLFRGVRHFRGQRVMLIWDGLGAHKSLNPVELLWGNLKGRELANLCPADIAALRSPVRADCTRIRRQPALAFAFLRHAGLGL